MVLVVVRLAYVQTPTDQLLNQEYTDGRVNQASGGRRLKEVFESMGMEQLEQKDSQENS